MPQWMIDCKGSVIVGTANVISSASVIFGAIPTFGGHD
ncbi:MAG: hypothetical protein QOD96_7330, partial [Pseudonocardiales bacterium]|nr:hypothetical protein [Pseudonocardiales bacterium]